MLMSSWCPVDVQLLFSCCPMNHWTTSVEPLCFYCTEIEPTPLVHPCYLLATLWELRRYTFPASQRSIKVLQYYRLQFQYFRFQISVCFLEKRLWIRIQNTVLCSVFSIQFLWRDFFWWQMAVYFLNCLA